jgi:hypothetical protein
MARLKGSTLQLITAILLLGCIGCNQKERVNMTVLLDCSSSVSEDLSSLKQNVLDAGCWWADHAANRGCYPLFLVLSLIQPATDPLQNIPHEGLNTP